MEVFVGVITGIAFLKTIANFIVLGSEGEGQYLFAACINLSIGIWGLALLL